MKNLPSSVDLKVKFLEEVNNSSPGAIHSFGRLQELLNANADINYCHANGQKTALHVAVEKGNLPLVKFLLCNKADVDSRNGGGATSLIEAAFQGKVEVVKLLLARCADTDLRSKTYDNKTALMYVQDRIDYCEKISSSAQTESFAQPQEFSKNQKSCLYNVAAFENIAKLIKGTNHTLSRENFSDALSHHDINYIKDALDNDFNANYCHPESTSLHDAAYYGKTTILALLLEHGMDVNRQAANGNTPLMLAAYNHHFDFLKHLLWYGADAALVKNKNETALSIAIGQYEEGNNPEFLPIISCLKNVTDCLTNWLKEDYINPYIKKLPDLPNYVEEYTFESTKDPISGHVEFVYTLTARNETNFIVGTIKLPSRRSACYSEESQFLTAEGIFEQPLQNDAHAMTEFLAAFFSKRILIRGLSAGAIGATRGFLHVLVSRHGERTSISFSLRRLSSRIAIEIAIQAVSCGISYYLNERSAIHGPQNESTTFDPALLLVVFFLSQVIVEEVLGQCLGKEKTRYILLGLCAFCVVMFPIGWDEILINLVMGMLGGTLGQFLGRKLLSCAVFDKNQEPKEQFINPKRLPNRLDDPIAQRLRTSYECEYVSEGIEQLLAYYTPLGIKHTESSESQDPATILDTWVKSKGEPVLTILGDSGSGKTTLTHFWERSWWKAYEEGALERLPVRFHLADFTTKSIKKGLVKALAERSGVEVKQAEASLSTYPFILLLDGYDEGQWDSQKPYPNLYRGAGLKGWNVKVLITCRQRLFREISTYSGCFFLSENKLYEMVYLASFTNKQIEQYISHYIEDNKRTAISEVKAVNYTAYLENNKSLVKLLRIPILLNLFLRSYSSEIYGHDKKINRWLLYETFLSDLFEKQRRRHWKNIPASKIEAAKSQFEEVSIQLALRLFYEGKQVISFNDEKKALKYKIFFEEEELWGKAVREGYPLRKVKDNVYGFVHKSFIEHFVAKHWLTLLEVTNDACVEQWGQSNLVEHPAVLASLREAIESSPNFPYRDKLWGIIYIAQKSQPKFAGSNALTLLKALKEPFNNQDLRNLYAPGVDLSHYNFDHTNFEFAILKGANLSNSIFRYANFCGADLTEVQWGQMPFLAFSKRITALAYAPDGIHVAIGFDDETMQVNLKTQERQRLASYGASSLCYSPNGAFLVSGRYKVLRILSMQSYFLCKAVLARNSDDACSICYSPNGIQFASGYWNGTIGLWAENAEKEWGVSQLPGHSERVTSLCYSPDGERLASGSYDGTVKLWLTVMHECQHTFTHSESRSTEYYGGVNCVQYSSDGTQLVSGGESKVKIWSLANRCQVAEFSCDGNVWQVFYTPRGNQLMVVLDAGRVSFWSTKNYVCESNMDLTPPFHQMTLIDRLAYSPKEGQLAIPVSNGGGGSILSIMLSECMVKDSPYKERAVLYGAWACSPSGQQLAYASTKNKIALVSLSPLRHIVALKGHVQPVMKICYSPKGERFASIGEDKTIRFWSTTPDYECKATLTRHEKEIDHVSFSYNSKWLVMSVINRGLDKDNGEVGPDSYSLLIFSMSTLTEVSRLELEGRTSYLYFSPINDTELVFDYGNHNVISVALFNVFGDLSLKVNSQLKGHVSNVKDVCYLPNGRQLISHSYNELRLWSMKNYKSRPIFPDGERAIEGICCYPDGKRLVVWGADAVVQLVSISSGERLDCFFYPNILSVIVAQDKLISKSRDGSIIVWEASSNAGADNSLWHMVDSMRPHLLVEGMDVKGAKGLTSLNQYLLAQGGATNVCNEEDIPGSNPQQADAHASTPSEQPQVSWLSQESTKLHKVQESQCFLEPLEANDEKRCFLLKTDADGNCGFSAIQKLLLFLGCNELSSLMNRDGFIKLVQNNTETHGKYIKNIYLADKSGEGFGDWRAFFIKTSSYLADEHFRLISKIYNIVFYFYSYNFLSSRNCLWPELGNECINETSKDKRTILLHLAHVPASDEACLPNHFEGIVIDETGDSLEIQSKLESTALDYEIKKIVLFIPLPSQECIKNTSSVIESSGKNTSQSLTESVSVDKLDFTEHDQVFLSADTKKISSEKSVWYQYVNGGQENFHYVYLKTALQITLQLIVEGADGLQSSFYKMDTYAEGNERLPMQIGFSQKEAALKFLTKCEEAIMVLYPTEKENVHECLSEKSKIASPFLVSSQTRFVSIEEALNNWIEVSSLLEGGESLLSMLPRDFSEEQVLLIYTLSRYYIQDIHNSEVFGLDKSIAEIMGDSHKEIVAYARHWHPIVAVLENRMDIVKQLIDYQEAIHFNVNEMDEVTGRTCLHWAALKQHAIIVSLLLQARADLYAKDATGNTPFKQEAYSEQEHKDLQAQTVSENEEVLPISSYLLYEKRIALSQLMQKEGIKGIRFYKKYEKPSAYRHKKQVLSPDLFILIGWLPSVKENTRELKLKRVYGELSRLLDVPLDVVDNLEFAGEASKTVSWDDVLKRGKRHTDLSQEIQQILTLSSLTEDLLVLLKKQGGEEALKQQTSNQRRGLIQLGLKYRMVMGGTDYRYRDDRVYTILTKPAQQWIEYAKHWDIHQLCIKNITTTTLELLSVIFSQPETYEAICVEINRPDNFGNLPLEGLLKSLSRTKFDNPNFKLLSDCIVLLLQHGARRRTLQEFLLSDNELFSRSNFSHPFPAPFKSPEKLPPYLDRGHKMQKKGEESRYLLESAPTTEDPVLPSAPIIIYKSNYNYFSKVKTDKFNLTGNKKKYDNLSIKADTSCPLHPGPLSSLALTFGPNSQDENFLTHPTHQGESHVMQANAHSHAIDNLLSTLPYQSCAELTNYYQSLQHKQAVEPTEGEKRELELLKKQLLVFIGTMKLKTHQQYADVLFLAQLNEPEIKEALLVRFSDLLLNAKALPSDSILLALSQLLQGICYSQSSINQELLYRVLVQLLPKAVELQKMLGTSHDPVIHEALQSLFYTFNLFKQHYPTLPVDTLKSVKADLKQLKKTLSFETAPGFYLLLEQLDEQRHALKKNVASADQAQSQHRMAPEARHGAVRAVKGSGQLLTGTALLAAAITGTVFTAGILTPTIVPAARLFVNWGVKGGLKHYYRGFGHARKVYSHYRKTQVVNRSLAIEDLDKSALERLATELTKADVQKNLLKIKDAAEGAEIIQRLGDILLYGDPSQGEVLSGVIQSIFSRLYKLSLANGDKKTRDRKLQAFILAKSDELHQAGYGGFPCFEANGVSPSIPTIQQFTQVFLPKVYREISDQDWGEYSAFQSIPAEQQKRLYEKNPDFWKKFKRINLLVRRLAALSEPPLALTTQHYFSCGTLWDDAFKGERKLIQEVELLYGKLTSEIHSTEEKTLLEAMKSYLYKHQLVCRNSRVLLSFSTTQLLNVFYGFITTHRLYGLLTLEETMDDKKKMTELGSLAHFGHLTIEGTMGVVERETVLSRKLTVAEVLEYESGSTDIRYKDDKRRKHKNNPKRPLASADKTYVKKGGHIDVKGSVLKDGGGNLSQQRASSTLFFNSESIVHRCTNGQHVVKINYNLLKLTEEQRLNLQTILKGRDGLEAFKFIPGSTQQRRDCIMQLAFESAYSAKNLIIALKQALSSYQEVSFSPQECFSETPWLEAITYKEEAGEYLVMIDYPPLRLTQVERTHLQVILEKIKKDNFDCEPEKTVTSKSCIQQLVFVSEKSAQACLAKLYASMESGLQEDELLQEGQNEGKEEAYSPRQVSFAANPL